MLTIARLNWPYYLAAALVLAATLAGCFWLTATAARWLCAAAAFGAGWFLIGSLGFAHLIYDRSDLYRFGWLDRWVRNEPGRRYLFCHCGFDETSAALRQKLTGAEWLIVDHFRPEQMTEASIQRARRLFPPRADTVSAAHDAWPAPTGFADVIFALLTIHELRSEEERSRWFSEAKRCLDAGGRVLLVEHLRDWPNFLAFGPAVFHFHTRSSWQRAWERAGLRLLAESRVTPWVRVFVLGAAEANRLIGIAPSTR